MTYQEAIHIDRQAEGIIKATYAMLYDEHGNKLFALQRTDCEIEDENLITVKDFGGRGRKIIPVGKDTFVIKDIPEETQAVDFTWDMPVVHAVDGTSKFGGRVVPVQLIKEAIAIIKEKTDRPRYTYYKVIADYKKVPFGNWYKRDMASETVYAGYKYPKNLYNGEFSFGSGYINQKMVDKSLASVIRKLAKYFSNTGKGVTARSGFLNRMQKAYNSSQESALQILLDEYYDLMNQHKDEMPDVIYYNINTKIDASETRYDAKYERLLSKLNTTSIFYVKPVAFNWYPTTIDDVQIDAEGEDGTIQIPLTEAIRAAKKKLDNAKAILAMASATMII